MFTSAPEAAGLCARVDRFRSRAAGHSSSIAPLTTTSISPISKPLMVRSISLEISMTSLNSSFRASTSQPEFSPYRLRARRNKRRSASPRSETTTAGISAIASFRAASTSPQPATTRFSRSIRIGRTKPNRSRLSASFRICAGGCLRVSRPEKLQKSKRAQVWDRGYGRRQSRLNPVFGR